MTRVHAGHFEPDANRSAHMDSISHLFLVGGKNLVAGFCNKNHVLTARRQFSITGPGIPALDSYILVPLVDHRLYAKNHSGFQLHSLVRGAVVCNQWFLVHS